VRRLPSFAPVGRHPDHHERRPQWAAFVRPGLPPIAVGTCFRNRLTDEPGDERKTMQKSSSRLSERATACRRKMAAQDAAKSPADHRRAARDIELTRLRYWRYIADMARRAGEHTYARRLLAELPTVPTRRSARPRGAGRPARRASARSSARSGDSGDGEPGEPPPLDVGVAIGERSTGDAAVARIFERILAAQHPGTTWSATP